MTWLEVVVLLACLCVLGLFYGVLIVIDVRNRLNGYAERERYKAAIKHQSEMRKRGGK